MMEHIPLYTPLLFCATLAACILLFYRAVRSKTFLWITALWLVLQTTLAMQGVFLDFDFLPPKIMLFGIFPALAFIVFIFVSKRGKAFMASIDLRRLTYFHSIRIPVEIVLYLLYSHGVVSVYMTFEGTNFDILSGLSAPIVALYAFGTVLKHRKLLLWWNIISLALLLNVVITAVFAFPSPFQKLAFNQPNIAVLHAPYNLLPAFIVPLVLFSHLVAIKRLTKKT